jgi:hypothetical protein
LINTIIKYFKLIPLLPRIFYEKIGHKIVDVFNKSELLKYYLIPLNVKKVKLTIVTGCDSSHFKSQLQFLNSLYKHEPVIKTVYYDLGISDEQRKIIADNFPFVVIKKFNFSKYPDFFNIKKNAGEYAWKPIIIWKELNNSSNLILWLDAGTIIINNLNSIRRILKIRGFYSPISSGVVKEWTHEGMIRYLNITDDILNKRNLSGGVVGYNSKNRKARLLAEQCFNYAKEKECIAPSGSNRSNHRQDQALLTVLAYKFNMVKGMPKRYYGFDVHRDID